MDTLTDVSTVDTLLYRLHGVTEGTGMEDEQEKLLNHNQSWKRSSNIPATPDRSVRRRLMSPVAGTVPLTPTHIRSINQVLSIDTHAPPPTPTHIQSIDQMLSVDTYAPPLTPTRIRSNDTMLSVDMQRPLTLTCSINQVSTQIQPTGDLKDADENRLHHLPATKKADWPLKYVTAMAEGFDSMATMTGTLSNRFQAAFPSVKGGWKKTCWNKHYGIWKRATEADKENFVNAGFTRAGEWRQFVKTVCSQVETCLDEAICQHDRHKAILTVNDITAKKNLEATQEENCLPVTVDATVRAKCQDEGDHRTLNQDNSEVFTVDVIDPGDHATEALPESSITCHEDLAFNEDEVLIVDIDLTTKKIASTKEDITFVIDCNTSFDSSFDDLPANETQVHVCSYCDGVWPTIPSSVLLSLRKQLEWTLGRQGSKRLPSWKRMSALAEHCEQHKIEAIYEAQPKARKWPSYIDFSKLGQRVEALKTHLSQVWSDPWDNYFYKAVLLQIEYVGKEKAFGRVGDLEASETATAG